MCIYTPPPVTGFPWNFIMAVMLKKRTIAPYQAIMNVKTKSDDIFIHLTISAFYIQTDGPHNINNIALCMLARFETVGLHKGGYIPAVYGGKDFVDYKMELSEQNCMVTDLDVWIE